MKCIFIGSFIDSIYAGEYYCNGDSGGPLMSDNRDNNEDNMNPKFLRGIFSFGHCVTIYYIPYTL